MGRDYEVLLFLNTGFPIQMKLLPHNMDLEQSFVVKFNVVPMKMTFAGIHFTVHVQNNGFKKSTPLEDKIVAAEL